MEIRPVVTYFGINSKQRWRMTQHIIAIDLLGHGQSDDALEPRQAYTIPGYAATLIEALRSLNITRAALVGWSLGGHISLEMIGQRIPSCRCYPLVGAPPIRRGILGMVRGFRTQRDLLLATKSVLNAHDQPICACLRRGEACGAIPRRNRSHGRSRTPEPEAWIDRLG